MDPQRTLPERRIDGSTDGSLIRRIDRDALAWAIDAALLRPDAAADDLVDCVEECLSLGVKALCMLPRQLRRARSLVDSADGGLDLCGVVDFPLGSHSTEEKVAEARRLINAGADELDAVINLGWLKSRRLDELRRELDALRRIASSKVLKIIVECPLLDADEAAMAAELCLEAGVDYVKTGTGTRGAATTEHVFILRSAVGSSLDVKAAGGIRSLRDAAAMFEAGANRLGTSSAARIIAEHDELNQGRRK